MCLLAFWTQICPVRARIVTDKLVRDDRVKTVQTETQAKALRKNECLPN